MSNTMKKMLIPVCAVVMVACKNVVPDEERSAVIVNPTDESRAALQQAVDAALNTRVLLADDALTDTSLLVIDRQVPRSIEGAPAQGRTMEMPFQFRLVTDGTNCVLVDKRDGTRHVLANTECVAE